MIEFHRTMSADIVNAFSGNLFLQSLIQSPFSTGDVGMGIGNSNGFGKSISPGKGMSLGKSKG